MKLKTLKYLKTIHEAEPFSGTYLLILISRKTALIDIGKVGSMRLLKGHYCYVGSAFGPGGIKSRVNRHTRIDKALRWHIDYLRKHCTLACTYINYSNIKQESQWVARFLGNPDFQIPKHGFGSSDSHYPSHLFYSAVRPTDQQISDLLAINKLVKLIAD